MPDQLGPSNFDPAVLRDAEAEIVAATERGNAAAFSAAAAPVIRAAFLRHLLLSLPAPSDPWAIRLPGVRIRGVQIEGLLDLAGCSGPDGTGLPALALEDCTFDGCIDLSGARVVRLSLRNSRIGEVRLRGGHIGGLLDISGVTPTLEQAWIDAHGATIEGDIVGRGARLQTPPIRSGVAHRDARYALRLSGAEIRGSLDLSGGFVAVGGIALDTARVHGDIVARTAQVTAGEGDAIGAQAGRFDGVVILADGFASEGVIWLMGAHIAGTLDMNGAHLSNLQADGAGVVLAADTAQILGSALLRNGFTARGAISLRGTKIDRSLECDGASLANPTPDGTGVALAADHAEIGGAMLLRNGFATQGAISLIGVKIGGNLELDGASLTNATPDGTGTALVAENAVIGGAVLMRHGFVAHGSVSLLGATIDSNVECSGARLENWSDTGSRETLRLTNVAISGDLLLNVGFHSLGYVSLWGAKIGRDLDCSRSTFIGPSSAASRTAAGALVGTNLTIAGDMRLIGVSVIGRLDCEHLELGGSLIWDGLRFPVAIEEDGTTYRYRSGTDAPPRLMLAHARIGAAIVARDLHAELDLSIDLAGARTGTLDDEGFPAGWGLGASGSGVFCALDLDGFVYDRFGHLPAEEASGGAARLATFFRWVSLSGRGSSASRTLRLARRMSNRLHEVLQVQRAHVRQRLEWVQRQQRRANEFHPQPYRHLAKVLRSQGHHQAARQVAIAEQWATPSSNWVSRALRPFWGLCFGFGFSPVNATVTVLVLLTIGTAGVWWAWKQADVMIVSYSYAMTEVADGAYFRRAESMQSVAPAPPCGPDDILPMFYAMDMMVPVMALHQIARCDVDTRPGTEWWRIAWALFSFLGKIVTSLALLTYSGVLKPTEEE